MIGDADDAPHVQHVTEDLTPEKVLRSFNSEIAVHSFNSEMCRYFWLWASFSSSCLTACKFRHQAPVFSPFS